jgi:nucleotide-binding universal stress UspA family protein
MQTMNDSTEHTLPVLVCVDGSEGALAATTWAATYAARVHAPLRLVHAVPDGDWYGSAQFVDGGALEDDLRRAGHGFLTQAADAAQAAAPDLDVESVSADGTIADFVASTRAALVVLGSAKPNPLRDMVLGSNTIRIVNRAQSPVLVWRGDSDRQRMDRPIVVGIDGSYESDRALLGAMEMAQVFGAPVVAANFWGVAAEVGIGLGAGYVDWEKIRSDEKKWLEARVSIVRDKFPDVKVSVVSTDSTPARGLRTLSSSASLVVVGSKGRGAVHGAFLGSVSQNLVHHADCAVLVVR